MPLRALALRARPRARRAGRPAALLVAALLIARQAAAQETQGAVAGPERETRTGVILGGNLGVPKLGAGDVSLVGNLTAGYGASFGGIVASGGVEAYDSVSSRAIAASRRTQAGIDLWALPSTDRTRLELRLSGGFANYTTGLAERGAGSGTLLVQTSHMLRAAFAVGVRHEPSERTVVGVWLGAGGQVELYATGEASEAARNGSLGANASGLFTARLRILTDVWPETLALRFLSDVDAFGITRDASTFTLDASPKATLETQHATQIDVTTRLLLDIEALGFFGFVPNAHVGLDLFRATASGLPTSIAVVPLAGLGLRRGAF